MVLIVRWNMNIIYVKSSSIDWDCLCAFNLAFICLSTMFLANLYVTFTLSFFYLLLTLPSIDDIFLHYHHCLQ